LICWFLSVIVVSTFHEPWRDEVRALSIAIDAPSCLELPVALKNEGHPVLWYLVLRTSYAIFGTMAVLKIMSISIGFLGTLIFFAYSPFQNFVKIFFSLSVLPIYEYLVMSRNYGISMLLFFLLAVAVEKKKHPVVIALLLSLLANTNIHSCILVVIISVGWIIQACSAARGNKRDVFSFVLSVALVGGAVLFSLFTVMPTEESIVVSTSSLNVQTVIRAVVENLLHPGQHLDVIFLGIPAVFRDVLVLLFAVGLLVRPWVAAMFFCGVVSLGVFFSIGYSGSLRHQGVVFVFTLYCYWVTSSFSLPGKEKKGRRSRYSKPYAGIATALFSVILAGQAVGAVRKIHCDLTREMSSSKAFGRYLTEHPKLSSAIIMAEPDLRIESLPYYAANSIYLPREDVFRRYVRLTSENRRKLTLGKLLKTAVRLRKEGERDVLIALGHFGLAEQTEKPYVRTEAYGRIFTWTAEELAVFLSAAEKIVEFKSDVTNERYEIYRLK